MGLFDSALDSLEGVLADQWKDIVTVRPFTEHTVVAPGYRKRNQEGLGANNGLEDILSNGSIILVPENTAAFIFSQSGIEEVITTPGGYEYQNGETSLFNERDRREKGMGKILLDQAKDRFGFSGMSAEEKRVAFVNLREIRGIKFGTHGPLVYNDIYYGTDLEIYAYGSFSVQITDPSAFVRNFVPAGVYSYSLDDQRARSQMLSEFLHSFAVAVNLLSETHRVSQLPSQSDAISAHIAHEGKNAGSWEERFGFRLVSIGIENIELSDDSRDLIRGFSKRKMNVRAFEGVSQHAASMAAQQMIAEGVRDNGLGDAGGMLFGMNLAESLNPLNAVQQPGIVSATASTGPSAPTTTSTPSSIDDQIEMVKKLKDLLDAGILSQEEFDMKKKEILGI